MGSGSVTYGIPPIQQVSNDLLDEMGLTLYVKREDLAHPVLGGNKWYKLKYNLEAFFRSGREILVTFGGAWSNHVAAVACAGAMTGIRTAAVIRGERPGKPSLTLRRAEAQGMKLFFTGRSVYREREQALKPVIEAFGAERVFVIPAGGNNPDGFRGCLEMLDHIPFAFDYVCCPAATGTTLAGLAASTHKKVIGISVLNHDNLDQAVCDLAGWNSLPSRVSVIDDFRFGGFARSNAGLERFISAFTTRYDVPLEPVYTGKMFYGIHQLAERGFFERGSVMLALHTGGLQYLEKAG